MQAVLKKFQIPGKSPTALLSLVRIGDKIDFDFVDRTVDRIEVDKKSTVSASQ